MGDRLQQERTVQALMGFAAAQNELARLFARSRRLHTTDATAIVQILDAEAGGTPLTPARLAEQLGLTTGATSTLLNRLEDAGHIRRTRESTDRRVVTLHGTQTMQDSADAFYRPLAGRLQDVLADYTAGDLRRLEDLVTRLQATMRAYPDPGGPAAQG